MYAICLFMQYLSLTPVEKVSEKSAHLASNNDINVQSAIHDSTTEDALQQTNQERQENCTNLNAQSENEDPSSQSTDSCEENEDVEKILKGNRYSMCFDAVMDIIGVKIDEAMPTAVKEAIYGPLDKRFISVYRERLYDLFDNTIDGAVCETVDDVMTKVYSNLEMKCTRINLADIFNATSSEDFSLVLGSILTTTEANYQKEEVYCKILKELLNEDNYDKFEAAIKKRIRASYRTCTRDLVAGILSDLFVDAVKCHQVGHYSRSIRTSIAKATIQAVRNALTKKLNETEKQSLEKTKAAECAIGAAEMIRDTNSLFMNDKQEGLPNEPATDKFQALEVHLDSSSCDMDVSHEQEAKEQAINEVDENN